MERYDGKNRKDDYIKYALIGLAALVVIVGLSLTTRYLKKANQKEPDYTVVVASEEAFNDAMEQQLQDVLENLVGDRNGDGVELVELEFLRMTDAAAARWDAELQKEAYLEALERGEEASAPDSFSGVSDSSDFERMNLLLATGEVYLYLLSDQPRGEFRGIASAYCGKEYFAELPEDMQAEGRPDAAELTDAPFLVELGLEEIPFYGCVPDGSNGKEVSFAVEILKNLQTARATIFTN